MRDDNKMMAALGMSVLAVGLAFSVFMLNSALGVNWLPAKLIFMLVGIYGLIGSAVLAITIWRILVP